MLPEKNLVKLPYVFENARSSKAVPSSPLEVNCSSPPAGIGSEVAPALDLKKLFDRYSDVFDSENFKKLVRHRII